MSAFYGLLEVIGGEGVSGWQDLLTKTGLVTFEKIRQRAEIYRVLERVRKKLPLQSYTKAYQSMTTTTGLVETCC